MLEATAVRMTHSIKPHAEPAAMAYTDESKTYSSLKNHETINHGVG